MIKRFFLLLFLYVFISCNDKPKPQVYSGNALGTTFTIQFFANEEVKLASSIDSTFSVLNASLSTYIPTSDISRINQGDTSVVVDHQFVDNFLASKKIFKETDGFFDPSVGLLVNAYGFGPIKYNLDISNPKILDSLMQYVGLDHIQLKETNQLIFTPGVFLDFNAIAKGYSVDRLGVLLENNGVENYLVEVGGELVGKGLNLANMSSWRVGIDEPIENASDRSFSTVIELNGYGMATSGNYRKFSVDEQGNKFVHTIDPKTGLSTKSDVLSATVIAKTCMEADAYATAFMAMGSEKAIEFLQSQPHIFALLYIANGDETEIFKSTGLDFFLSD
jgi:thiamine biosynthesis lipoprotein